jgi:uncharacterized protein YuzE
MPQQVATIEIGPFRFSHWSYDAENDVAYLSIDAPREAVVWESPEGHLVRLDMETEELVGVTFLFARKCLDAGGLFVTFPESVLPHDQQPNGSPRAERVPRSILTAQCG